MIPKAIFPIFLTIAVGLALPLSSPINRHHHRQLIVGGHAADPDRFPYHVRLDYEGEFGCGGTLVRSDIVLTAAHCAFPEEDLGILTVTVGAVDPVTRARNRTRTVTQIIRHPVYHDDGDINDIALLKVDPPFDDSIPVIQLNSDRAVPRVGDSVTAIGLGAISEGGPDADVLQQVEIKIVPDEQCDDEYQGYLHRKSMICAADPDQDACEGDSGGMLAVLGDTPADDIQVGVVSFGDECAHEHIPGVYADVSYVYDWLERVLCQHSVDPPVGCQNATTSFIIDEDEECHDYPGAFYASWWYQFQRCDWLLDHGRVEQYCYKDNEAWMQCPFTCHSCTYEADDDYYGEESGSGSEEESEDESEDEDFHYESSSPLVMGMLLAISFAYCCTLCVWSCRRVRRSRRKPQEKAPPVVDEGAPMVVQSTATDPTAAVPVEAPREHRSKEAEVVEVPPANVTIF